MSRSTVVSTTSWPQYPPLPLTRCPDCPRMEPLKRLTCKKDDNGNQGREFVKCESKPQPGQALKKCEHFEWIDAYYERMQLEASIGATRELNLRPLAVEPVADIAVPMRMSDAEFNGELKKMRKQLYQLVDLQKQANMIAGAFYCCVIAMFFFYFGNYQK